MSWSKEDKKIFESSEVFKNMENRILENIKRLKIIASVEDLGERAKSTTPEVDNLTKSVGELSKAMEKITSDSDDGEVGQSEEVKGDGYSVTVTTNAPEEKENSTDEDISDAEDLETQYFKSTIAELKKAAYDAAISGDIKLAYKIERAIDEIIEVRDEDK